MAKVPPNAFISESLVLNLKALTSSECVMLDRLLVMELAERREEGLLFEVRRTFVLL